DLHSYSIPLKVGWDTRCRLFLPLLPHTATKPAMKGADLWLVGRVTDTPPSLWWAKSSTLIFVDCEGLPMSDQVVRCPYCVLDDQFRPMLRKPDWFVCDKCGHVRLPGDPDFKCACQKCLELNRIA